MPPEQLRVRQLKPSLLKAFPGNPRAHKPEQIEQLSTSIEEFGWTIPILIDEKNQILAGHGRWMAAKEKNLATVPTIKRTGLTLAQKQAYLLADNKLSQLSYFEQPKLAGFFDSIIEADFDALITGFSQGEIDFIRDPPEPFKIADKPEKKTAKKRAEKILRCPHCDQEFEP